LYPFLFSSFLLLGVGIGIGIVCMPSALVIRLEPFDPDSDV